MRIIDWEFKKTYKTGVDVKEGSYEDERKVCKKN